jgi:hypothetical protein
MKDIVLTNNSWDPEGYWSTPLPGYFTPKLYHVQIFDQVGFDLCELEQMYAKANNATLGTFGPYRACVQQPWFDQFDTLEGTILNHSNLFERKSFKEDARGQLKMWTKHFPRAWQLIKIKPKWGLDLNIDYNDYYGNVFEIVHWEYDGYSYEEMMEMKSRIEPIVESIDWQDAGQQILKLKDQWWPLKYTDQCDWKCDYFGIPREHRQLIVWE